MRRRGELRAVLAPAGERLTPTAISRQTGVPGPTVVRWLDGCAPRFDDPDACTCPRCGQQHPEALIRGLIESDGSRHRNRVRRRGRWYSYVRYTFSNRSADICAIFTEHLDLLDIPWRPDGPVNISIARREGVAALDAFVGPKA